MAWSGRGYKKQTKISGMQVLQQEQETQNPESQMITEVGAKAY
jgi:hypothetical protein